MSEESERPLLKPEEFDLFDKDEGRTKTFILSNFDAINGRKIITQYPLTAISKDYEANEKLMFLLMSFVAVVTKDGRKLRLSTPELIMNHVPDPEMLMKLEMKMMEKNCSFFRDGRSLDLLDNIAQIFSKKIFELLTQLSGSSSQPGEQPSTN